MKIRKIVSIIAGVIGAITLLVIMKSRLEEQR